MTETRNAPDALARWTRLALGLAAVSALIGVSVRGDLGLVFDSVSLLLLGTLPTLRVMVLAARWARGGDRRYASAAMALLFLMAIGVAVITTWR